MTEVGQLDCVSTEILRLQSRLGASLCLPLHQTARALHERAHYVCAATPSQSRLILHMCAPCPGETVYTTSPSLHTYSRGRQASVTQFQDLSLQVDQAPARLIHRPSTDSHEVLA